MAKLAVAQVHGVFTYWLGFQTGRLYLLQSFAKLTEVCHAGSLINMRRSLAMEMITITFKAMQLSSPPPYSTEKKKKDL